MSELITIDAKSISPASYSIDVEAVKATAEKYGSLTISGIGDKSGLKTVKEARLELKGIRTAIENRRKELKAGSLAYGKAVDVVAKEITALIEPTERLLEEREEAVAKEIAAIASAKLNDRMEKLEYVGCDYPRGAVEAMTDGMYESFLAQKTTDHLQKLEAARIVAEETERKRLEAEAAKSAEEARLKAEREENDRERAALAEAKRVQDAAAAESRRVEEERQAKERAALAEQQAVIDAARKKLEAEQYEQRRLAEIERVKQEAVETERQRAEESRQAEAKRAEAGAAEKARRDAVKPDREKLQSLAELIAAITTPTLSKGKSSQAAVVKCRTIISDAASAIRVLADTL